MQLKRRSFLGLTVGALGTNLSGATTPKRRTVVSIRGEEFLINGRPAYEGRTYNGKKVQGLLMNVRAVQAIFDDYNPETKSRWVYPDTKVWDPERNTREFLAALPEWRKNGLLAITLNLQGGTPGGPGRGGARGGAAGNSGGAGRLGALAASGRGRGPAGPTLENTAINPDGTLRADYMDRLARVLDKADELGVVVILGYFYFGQDQRMQNEEAIKKAVVNVTNWLFDRNYRNVMIEVNNECSEGYHHEILRPARVPELFQLIKNTTRKGRRFLVSASWQGTDSRAQRDVPDTPARTNVIAVCDYVLIHGNGPADNEIITRMIHATRGLPTYRKMPVLINEDPNFHFTEPKNHILTALDEYVSWGYYDQGQNNYQDGYQSPPVNWGFNTDDKRQFFAKVKEITGA